MACNALHGKSHSSSYAKHDYPANNNPPSFGSNYDKSLGDSTLELPLSTAKDDIEFRFCVPAWLHCRGHGCCKDVEDSRGTKLGAIEGAIYQRLRPSGTRMILNKRTL
jgi:hypothetical protein